MCDLAIKYQVLLLFVYIVLEAWLGRTEKVKANSFLELVFNILKTILQRR